MAQFDFSRMIVDQRQAGATIEDLKKRNRLGYKHIRQILEDLDDCIPKNQRRPKVDLQEVQRVYERNNNNASKTARELKLDRATVMKYIERARDR